jgi:molybdate transport system substrate-binding protein
MHTPLKQDALLLNAGKGNAAATALLTYLQGERARAIMRAYGYL